MKIQPFQMKFLDRERLEVKIFRGQTRQVLVAHHEAQTMMKTGKWIKPESEK